MERAAYARGHLAGLLAAGFLLCSLHLLKLGRSVNSSGPRRAEKLLRVVRRPLWRVRAVFAGILLQCFANWGDCSSYSSKCWCGGRKDGPQPVPSHGEVSRGHVYTGLALGKCLTTGHLKNSPLGKGISGMSNSRKSFTLRGAKAL